MPTKRAAIRLLVMLSCVFGMTYGALQIPRLPTGPRWVLARFGRWLQDQADSKVVAGQVGGTRTDLPYEARIQVPLPVEESVPNRELANPISYPRIQPERTAPPKAVSQPSPPEGTQPILGQLDRPAGVQDSTDVASSLAGLASQLQELGATNYLLEKWGDDGQLYRFQCEVAIGGQPGLRQHFEAVAPTGEEAIRRVLAGVTSNQ